MMQMVFFFLGIFLAGKCKETFLKIKPVKELLN